MSAIGVEEGVVMVGESLTDGLVIVGHGVDREGWGGGDWRRLTGWRCWRGLVGDE